MPRLPLYRFQIRPRKITNVAVTRATAPPVTGRTGRVGAVEDGDEIALFHAEIKPRGGEADWRGVVVESAAEVELGGVELQGVMLVVWDFVGVSIY